MYFLNFKASLVLINCLFWQFLFSFSKQDFGQGTFFVHFLKETWQSHVEDQLTLKVFVLKLKTPVTFKQMALALMIQN